MLNQLENSSKDVSTQASMSDLQSVRGAQLDMRKAYLDGSPGVLVSGFVWLVSGMIAIFLSPQEAIWALVIGGALIHPISIVVTKMLGATDQHSKENPFGGLAMQVTFFMLMCLPIALLTSFQKTEWFFQSMLLVIGGRYLTFVTLYGISRYWILGLGLGAAGFILFALNAASHTSIFVGSAMEIVFGIVLLTLAKKQ